MVLMQLRSAFIPGGGGDFAVPRNKAQKSQPVFRLAFYCAALRLVRVLIRLVLMRSSAIRR